MSAAEETAPVENEDELLAYDESDDEVRVRGRGMGNSCPHAEPPFPRGEGRGN